MTGDATGQPGHPVNLPVAGRLAVVVGGGAAALRQVAGLRASGAEVTVVAPELSPSLHDLAARGLIAARRRRYRRGDLAGAWLVYACTGRAEVDGAVAADAEELRLWCIRPGDRATRTPAAGSGQVWIVGGGPGDPDLITVAGLARLREADVVVTDRLAPAGLLSGLRPDVQVIDAAKVPGGPATRQEAINAALIEHALAGRVVVRLKGGDPFVFGRGMEEVTACRAAGVPVTVVPGVTSAVSVPAAAGIPVTHRGLSQGFAVVSGHLDPADPGSAVAWDALARSGLTLVLLMAAGNLAAIARSLIAAGLPAGTPAACVADGCTPRQRSAAAPLAGLAAAVREAGITSPAVVVIGETARYAAADAGPADAGQQADSGQADSGQADSGQADSGQADSGQADSGQVDCGQVDSGSAGAGLAGAGPAGDRAGACDTAASPAIAGGRARRVLVLGGARSGKSVAAERFLAGDGGPVEYVATGTSPDGRDPEWAARVAAHRQRRPPHWRTAETLDLVTVLGAGGTAPVLVECLTTWLARVMDDCRAWDGGAAASEAVAARVGALADAWRTTPRTVVAVSNEVGSGVVPATAAGRLFRDVLGALNARIAAESDEVWLCTAGIPWRLR